MYLSRSNCPCTCGGCRCGMTATTTIAHQATCSSSTARSAATASRAQRRQQSAATALPLHVQPCKGLTRLVGGSIDGLATCPAAAARAPPAAAARHNRQCAQPPACHLRWPTMTCSGLHNTHSQTCRGLPGHTTAAGAVPAKTVAETDAGPIHASSARQAKVPHDHTTQVPPRPQEHIHTPSALCALTPSPMHAAAALPTKGFSTNWQLRCTEHVHTH